MHDSAVSSCSHGCPAFLHRHFPPQSPPSSRNCLSQSTAALTLGLLHNPQTPAPRHCTFQGTRVPLRGMYGCSKDCLILIPFRLPHISCFILSLKCFSSDSDNCPQCGDWSPASFPPPTKGRSNPTNTPIFPPSSFVLRSFVWFYIFFSSGQVLLSALSWCSACTSVSEGVFLMYPWRKMYYTSTYSSVILFSPPVLNFLFDSSKFCVIYKSGSDACFVSCSILFCLFICLLFLLLLLKVGHLMYDNSYWGGSDSKEFACSVGDWIWSLGWKDSLEKGMATHSSFLAQRVPWSEEPGRLQSMELQRVGHDWAANTHLHDFILEYEHASSSASLSVWEFVLRYLGVGLCLKLVGLATLSVPETRDVRLFW